MNHIDSEFLANMGMASRGVGQSVMLIRETLEKCSDFQCALNKLANDTIIATAYFIVCGAKDNEAAVISRDRKGAADVAMITEEHWYRVQTNEDIFNGKCGERCGNATANFDKLGRDALTVESAYKNVLMVAPNLNFGSIYGIKMVPKLNLFEVEIANGTYHPNDM